MLWMGAAMVACCAVPIIIAVFLGGGLGIFFLRNTQSIPTNQPTSLTVKLSERTIPNR